MSLSTFLTRLFFYHSIKNFFGCIIVTFIVYGIWTGMFRNPSDFWEIFKWLYILDMVLDILKDFSKVVGGLDSYDYSYRENRKRDWYN